MDDVVKGFAAGLAATGILSIMMLAKAMAGIAPEFNIIGILAHVAEAPGLPVYGWLAHFAVGTFLWGGLFALASDYIGGPFFVKGMVFGIASWLLMMIAFFPIAGHALFGLDIGVIVPIMTLVLHVIFGLVLGYIYRALGGTAHTVDKLS